MKKESGLVVILGTMFGGKTAETIRRARIEEKAGKKVQAFKPWIDNRYDDGYIMTHDGAKFPAKSVKSVSEMKSSIDKDTEVLIFDEYPFWGYLLHEFVEENVDNYKIIENSLQSNFRGMEFYLRAGRDGKGDIVEYDEDRASSDLYSIMDLAPRGLIIVKYPDCLFKENGDICRANAIFPQRFLEDSSLAPYSNPEIVIGAGDKYSPRCVNHFARPLPNGNFMYHGEEHSQEELKAEHPRIYQI